MPRTVSPLVAEVQAHSTRSSLRTQGPSAGFGTQSKGLAEPALAGGDTLAVGSNCATEADLPGQARRLG